MSRTLRISSYVAPLVAAGFRGRVRGVFTNGFDVLTSEGRLVYLGSSSQPLSCIGVQLPHDELLLLKGKLKPGDVARAGGGFVRLFEGGSPAAAVDLRAATVLDLSFAGALSPQAAERLRAALERGGIGGGCGLAAAPGLAQALACLTEGGGRLETGILWLYGRGPGLTPSGDDILCGYGAGLLARGDAPRHARLLEALDRVSSQRTTTYMSRAYLDAMAEGYANEALCALAQAAREGIPLEGPLARARAYGHTSGADILLGLALSLKAGWGWANGAVVT